MRNHRMIKTFKYKDGDTIVITPKTKEIYIGCCDCGLVHRYEVEWKRKKVILKIFRDDEITKQIMEQR